MGLTCINLKERFGRRFKVVYEESYWADRGTGARAEDPWLLIVPGRYGHISPHGGNLLAASVDGYRKVAGVLRRLPCCRVHQDGDYGELTVLFDVGDFAKVARIVRPRRRRQVSEAERQRLQDMGFKKGSHAHVDVEYTARAFVAVGQDDPEHLPLQPALFTP